MNRRTIIALVVVGAALVLGAAACGGGGSASGDEGEGASSAGALEGEVGPGFTIEVSKDGEDAESLEAGTYTLKVEDKSDMHNFHLIGPGIDQAVTEVGFEGEKTATVTLQKGTYTYQCDPHASGGMKGTFEVT
jgi:hypothetical protein